MAITGTAKLAPRHLFKSPQFIWRSGSAFIKPDQHNPWIKDQLGNPLLSTILHLQLPNFCVMWEGQALLHDTKFGNCRCEVVGRRVIFIWSLIHGSSWCGLIKAEPSTQYPIFKRVEMTWWGWEASDGEWSALHTVFTLLCHLFQLCQTTLCK